MPSMLLLPETIESINQENKKSRKNRQSYCAKNLDHKEDIDSCNYSHDSSADSVYYLKENPLDTVDVDIVEQKHAEADEKIKTKYDSEMSTTSISKKMKYIHQEKKKPNTSRKTKCRGNNKNPNQETSSHVVANERNHDRALGGVLFIEKKLTQTDDSDYHQRLLVSCKQVINDEFLTREESETLRKKGSEGVKATLIDPCGRRYEVALKMERSGLTCDCYKIPKPWNLIRKNNGIRMGMVVQLWASRPNGCDLCFNLVLNE